MVETFQAIYFLFLFILFHFSFRVSIPLSPQSTNGRHTAKRTWKNWKLEVWSLTSDSKPVVCGGSSQKQDKMCREMDGAGRRIREERNDDTDERTNIPVRRMRRTNKRTWQRELERYSGRGIPGNYMTKGMLFQISYIVQNSVIQNPFLLLKGNATVTL